MFLKAVLPLILFTSVGVNVYAKSMCEGFLSDTKAPVVQSFDGPDFYEDFGLQDRTQSSISDGTVSISAINMSSSKRLLRLFPDIKNPVQGFIIRFQGQEVGFVFKHYMKDLGFESADGGAYVYQGGLLSIEPLIQHNGVIQNNRSFIESFSERVKALIEQKEKKEIYIHLESVFLEKHGIPKLNQKSIHESGSVELMGFQGVYSDSPLTPNRESYSYFLLRETMKMIQQNPKAKVLVVGAGNGYETISLLKQFPNLKIDATEIDPLSLYISRLNARAHGVQQRVRFIESNLFNNVKGQYDIIVFAAPRAIHTHVLRDTLIKYNYPNGKYKNYVIDELLDEQRETLISLPGKYDIDGRLMSRVLSDYKKHLTQDGFLLLMNDENIQQFTDRPLKSKALFTGPWSVHSHTEGKYSVHQIWQ